MALRAYSKGHFLPLFSPGSSMDFAMPLTISIDFDSCSIDHDIGRPCPRQSHTVELQLLHSSANLENRGRCKSLNINCFKTAKMHKKSTLIACHFGLRQSAALAQTMPLTTLVVELSKNSDGSIAISYQFFRPFPSD